MAISIVALAGLARNMAEKRDYYSDPLCKAFWNKPLQVGENAPQAKTKARVKPEGEVGKRRVSEIRQPDRTVIKYTSIPKTSLYQKY